MLEKVDDKLKYLEPGTIDVEETIMMTRKVDDKLKYLEPGSINIEGYLGKRIDRCIKNGIMSVDYTLYSEAFRLQYDDPSNWGGEFWGKWFTSIAWAYRYKPLNEYRSILDDAVQKLMEAQEENGRLSSYKEDFGNWDIWGRKYAMLGLVAYYELTGDKNALESACCAADALIRVTGPGKRKVTETGLQILQSLSSSSVLEPIVLIYKHTGKKEYLDYAEYIVKLWSEPNIYTEKGMKLIEDAIKGVHPAEISSPKAYEMMSCFEGVCELYRVTGNKLYYNAVLSFANSLIEKEIMINGSGSCCELWCDGASRQTELLENPVETCVTATWMKFCFHLLRLTGDSSWADHLEITLYNALLGAMMPEGDWWSYFSPLTGWRRPSHIQVKEVKSSCCVASGPRGLMSVPHWSVMKDETGLVVNLYSKGKWESTLNNGERVCLVQDTVYPENGEVHITLSHKIPMEYSLCLRIPSWSNNTHVAVNSETIECVPGKYLKIFRKWESGDKITINFEMSGRIVSSLKNFNYKAVMTGPIVLALDSRLVDFDDRVLWLMSNELKWNDGKTKDSTYALLGALNNNVQPIEIKPVKEKPEEIWLAYEVPFLRKPTHFFGHKNEKLVLCDYQSAGNLFKPENSFRSWFPQPLHIKDAFPTNGTEAESSLK